MCIPPVRIRCIHLTGIETPGRLSKSSKGCKRETKTKPKYRRPERSKEYGSHCCVHRERGPFFDGMGWFENQNKAENQVEEQIDGKKGGEISVNDQCVRFCLVLDSKSRLLNEGGSESVSGEYRQGKIWQGKISQHLSSQSTRPTLKVVVVYCKLVSSPMQFLQISSGIKHIQDGWMDDIINNLICGLSVSF